MTNSIAQHRVSQYISGKQLDKAEVKRKRNIIPNYSDAVDVRNTGEKLRSQIFDAKSHVSPPPIPTLAPKGVMGWGTAINAAAATAISGMGPVMRNNDFSLAETQQGLTRYDSGTQGLNSWVDLNTKLPAEKVNVRSARDIQQDVEALRSDYKKMGKCIDRIKKQIANIVSVLPSQSYELQICVNLFNENRIIMDMIGIHLILSSDVVCLRECRDTTNDIYVNLIELEKAMKTLEKAKTATSDKKQQEEINHYQRRVQNIIDISDKINKQCAG